MRTWLNRWQQHRFRRAAYHLQAWLLAVQQAHACCQASLALRRPPDDLGQLLDAVDLPLMRCRCHEGPARRALVRREPELARRLSNLTNQAFVVRNLFFRYLVCWGTYDELGIHAVRAQREMEEARLDLSRAVRLLAAELAPVADQIHALARQWGPVSR